MHISQSHRVAESRAVVAPEASDAVAAPATSQATRTTPTGETTETPQAFAHQNRHHRQCTPGDRGAACGGQGPGNEGAAGGRDGSGDRRTARRRDRPGDRGAAGGLSRPGDRGAADRRLGADHANGVFPSHTTIPTHRCPGRGVFPMKAAKHQLGGGEASIGAPGNKPYARMTMWVRTGAADRFRLELVTGPR